MLASFKRFFLLTALALTGLAAVLVTLAVIRSGRSPEALAWAVKGAIAHGYLLLVSFAAYTALDRPRCRLPAIAGMMMAAFMLLATPVFVWWEVTDRLALHSLSFQVHERLHQLIETGLLAAGLACIIPFVLVPRMKRVGRIFQLTTILYLLAACYFTLLPVWHISAQSVQEAVAALLIPAGVCMVGVFVLHKFLEIEPSDPFTAVAPVIHVSCPRCQSAETLGLGESRCSRCRLKFSIAVEEPRCPNCHFNLHGLTRPLCPECGFALDQEDIPALPLMLSRPAA